MKSPDDTKTPELPGIDAGKRGRGRPKKPDARTNAQRQKDYRDRKRAEREARRKPENPLTSKVLDLSGDLARALRERGSGKK